MIQHSKYVLFVSLLFCAQLISAQTTFVVVAANMKDAFTEINQEFQKENKSDLKVIFGSSGNLASQIMNGAPFHLFISADEQYPIELFKKGRTIDEGKIYAIGTLALISNKAKGISVQDSREGILNAITRANKIALAKPELAPYGKASIEYLKANDLWDLAKNKIVFADNIAMATMFVTTGSADIGFTALSIAKSPAVLKETTFIELSKTFYQPIRQRIVLIKTATPDAKKLYDFMQSSKAKAILQSYGFETP
jgi:molybdate transport system substrate-binding protein